MTISRLWLLVLSLQLLVLSLPRPEARPRLRTHLGRGVDPPHLQLPLVLLPRVYLLPRGEAGLAWGEVVLLVLLGVAASLGDRRLADCRLAQPGGSL